MEAVNKVMKVFWREKWHPLEWHLLDRAGGE